MEPEQLPVSLHGVFWTSHELQHGQLEEAARDWYAAMAVNAGFLGGVVQRPAVVEADAARAAEAPWGGATHAVETTSFWRTEKDRAAWVLTAPHDPVFARVTDQATDRISNRLALEHLLGSPVGAAAIEHSVYTAASEPEWLQLRRDLLDAAAFASSSAGFCCFAVLRPLAREQRTTFASHDRLLSCIGAASAHDVMEMETICYWRTQADMASWKLAAADRSKSGARKPVKQGWSAVLHSWGVRASDHPRL